MNQYPTNIIDVSEATFESEVIERSREKAVVVDFWASWCGPCRMLGPVLERLAGEPDSNFILAKVDVDANPGLSQRYQVQGIPAVKGFRNGQVAAEFVGAQPEPKVRQFLRELIPSEVDLHLIAANELLQEGKWPEAEGAFRLVLQRAPRNQTALAGLTRVLLFQGQGCEAEQLLSALTEPAFTEQAERLQLLAHFLCQSEQAEQENGHRVISPGSPAPAAPLEAQYERAAQLVRIGNLPAAFDGLLEIIRQDKQFHQGEPKAVMLALFALLGDENALTKRYRSELAMVLF